MTDICQCHALKVAGVANNTSSAIAHVVHSFVAAELQEMQELPDLDDLGPLPPLSPMDEEAGPVERYNWHMLCLCMYYHRRLMWGSNSAAMTNTADQYVTLIGCYVQHRRPG